MQSFFDGAFSLIGSMSIFGTVVNVAAILVGGAAGLMLNNGLKENYRTIINQAIGLSVVFVGASGCIAAMGKPQASPILFILSLALGGILGELLKIEQNLERLGDWLQSRVKVKEGVGSVSRGFVAASLLFCVGTMAVMGSFESGVQGKHTILYAKSLLDGITSIVMASTLGVGVLFSAASVFLYQGALTVLAGFASPYLTAEILTEISIVGGILITAIGLNMLGITKIKVGNLLPSLLVPVIYYLIISLF